MSEHVTGDEVDDGFEVSFGSVALGLALGGLDIAVDRLRDAIGKAGGDRSEDAFRLGRDRLGQFLHRREVADLNPGVPRKRRADLTLPIPREPKALRPCARRSSDSSLAAHARATACDAGRNPDAATFHPSCREPRNPRARIRRRRTGSRAENPHTNRADHPRPQIRYASPSTATATQGPTGKDRCLASPHNKLDPNRSLPKPTQKTALPTPFSEEPNIIGGKPILEITFPRTLSDNITGCCRLALPSGIITEHRGTLAG